jgi:hypothetical protein
MHTLSPAAMAAIRTLMAELESASITRKRGMKIEITSDVDSSSGETFSIVMADLDGCLPNDPASVEDIGDGTMMAQDVSGYLISFVEPPASLFDGGDLPDFMKSSPFHVVPAGIGPTGDGWVK